MTTYIPDYNEYPEETSNPFSTIKKTLKNIPKMFPEVRVFINQPSGQGAGIELSSENEEQLKKAFIMLCYANDEKHYNELVKNGTLEHELKSMGFYDYENEDDEDYE